MQEVVHAGGVTEQEKPPARSLATLWSAAAIFVVDRVCKALALSGAQMHLGNSSSFMLFRNTGAAFSVPVHYTIFTAISVVVLAFIAFRALREWQTHHALPLGIALILSGGVSNVIDRLAYSSTIDYLVFFERSAVNLADAALVAGIVVALLPSSRLHK